MAQPAFVLADMVIAPGCLPAELGIERSLVFATLDQSKGSKLLAAEALRVGVKTLYNRLHECGATGGAATGAIGTYGP